MECVSDWQGMIDALTGLVWLVVVFGSLLLVGLMMGGK